MEKRVEICNCISFIKMICVEWRQEKEGEFFAQAIKTA